MLNGGNEEKRGKSGEIGEAGETRSSSQFSILDSQFKSITSGIPN